MAHDLEQSAHHTVPSIDRGEIGSTLQLLGFQILAVVAVLVVLVPDDWRVGSYLWATICAVLGVIALILLGVGRVLDRTARV
jgi:hypothetical protein